jgi:hypothetical protein
MAEATEIRIGFERDGKPASTTVKIHGAPVAETKVALETGTGMPAEPAPAPDGRPARKQQQRKDTIVITEESASPGEDDGGATYY